MAIAVRLVLVHGSLFNAAQWSGYADRLGPGVEVVTPDLPGHGSRRGEVFTWGGALDAVGAAVAGAVTGQRVVVAGHSLGGYVAAGVAARDPARVAGLGLLGATAEPRGVGAAAYRGLAGLYGRVGAQRAGTMAAWQLRKLKVDQAVVSAMVAGGVAAEVVDAAWPAVIDHGGTELMRGVRGPVLLMAGQYDQLRIGMRRFAQVAAVSASPVRQVIVPRALHVFPLTHPEQTAGELSWLCSATMQR